MMYLFIYRILYLPIFLLLFPYYLYRMVKRGGYGRNCLQRLGFDLPFLHKKTKKRFWVHAVSVGELMAAKGLLAAIIKEHDCTVVLSVTTSTAYQLAKKTCKELTEGIFYFPFDFWYFSERTWAHMNPDSCILMEGELWPENLAQAQKRGVPVFLVNGRLSTRSFKGYKRIHFLAKKLIWPKIRHIFTASALDARRFEALGIAKEDITQTESLKWDAAATASFSLEEKRTFLHTLGLKAELILAGLSTWPGEEVLLLDILEAALKEGLNAALILIPRHVERAHEIKTLISAKSNIPQDRVYLVEVTGSLPKFAQCAHLAFIGKTLGPNEGGQNPIEAAALGIPSIHGPNTGNFSDIYGHLDGAGAAFLCENPTAALTTALDLLKDEKKRIEAGQSALETTKNMRGANKRILEGLKRHLLC